MTYFIDDRTSKEMSDNVLEARLNERAFEDASPDFAQRIAARAALEPCGSEETASFIQKLFGGLFGERGAGLAFASFALVALLIAGLLNFPAPQSAPAYEALSVAQFEEIEALAYDDLDLAFANVQDEVVQDPTSDIFDDDFEGLFIGDLEEVFL